MIVERGGVTHPVHEVRSQTECERCHQAPRSDSLRWPTLCAACVEHLLDIAGELQEPGERE
jgi:hypothetical protein